MGRSGSSRRLNLPPAPARTAHAFPEETLRSVVSVLPVWPGRAQGGRVGPPDVAPEGSGVVLYSGIIATAWHVVEPAERIDVRLSDGRVVSARDIAVIGPPIHIPVIVADRNAVPVAPSSLMERPDWMVQPPSAMACMRGCASSPVPDA